MLAIHELEGDELNTPAMIELYPELRFVFNLIDDLRDERDNAIRVVESLLLS